MEDHERHEPTEDEIIRNLDVAEQGVEGERDQLPPTVQKIRTEDDGDELVSQRCCRLGIGY